MLKSGTTSVLRAIRLLWERMGAARFYVLAATGVIIFLAVEGAFHLVRKRTQSTPSVDSRTTSNAPGEFSRAMPPPRADDAIPDNPLIAITEVAPEKKFGRHGEARIDVKIGVTPQPGVRKGHVEIRVFFYDVTPSREMRPTQARVSYQWITPVRDWTAPSPKYLVATYFRPRETRPSSEDLQYGGFIVRIYFDGQLQDERSEPQGVLAALRSGIRSVPAPTQAESAAIAAAVPSPGPSQAALPRTATAALSLSPTASPGRSEKRTGEETAALPYARPVPDKPGFVYSPYDAKFLIDVRGAPPGTVVNDPNSGKAFRVP
jgi:hypothetical protein